jgi:transposase
VIEGWDESRGVSRLSKEELIDIILAQAREIELLECRSAGLEAKLGGLPKSSDNSSLAPSRDGKANKRDRPPGARREAGVGRAGGSRRLHPHPDRAVQPVAKRCSPCRAALTAAAQRPLRVHDKIE